MGGWVGWGVLKGCEWIERRGRRKVHHYILFVALSSLVHETIVLINLIKLTKMKTKHASVQNKKEGFIHNILFYCTLRLFPCWGSFKKRAWRALKHSPDSPLLKIRSLRPLLIPFDRR